MTLQASAARQVAGGEGMRSIQIPELKFSNWYAWANRLKYPLKEYPGVYLVAITPKANLSGQRPKFVDVVYIGMTRRRTGLRGRWADFDRAIKTGHGHSGGNIIYKYKGPYSTWSDHLYVAAMGVECDVLNPDEEDYLRMGWVAYLEYEAFAFYCRDIGGHPRYNKL
jgi:hypothetical protein